MSIFVKATVALPARTSASWQIAIFYAGLLTALAVAQLFTLEEFIPIIQHYGLPIGEHMSYLLGPIIILCEVFALPFLLRMRLSPAMRWVSMSLGIVAALIWLILSVWAVLHASTLDTVGFIGGVTELVPGWWAVFLSFAMILMALWSSWGLWPGSRK